ncbi:DUF533 domain-containing protein [Halomonas sp. GXIMD04776]|uniref:DUF533 domain-containing protein n=1 Tax=Halomonas sp. GXIMD04776 TaxID=3415605 RepID=UPI003CA1CEC1
MEDKGAWDHLRKAAEELCDSSQGRGVDTRSALAGGLLGLLVSTRGGRTLLGKTLKYGIVAGLGALAWQSRQRDQAGTGRIARDSFSTTDGVKGTSEDAVKGTSDPGGRDFPSL